MNIDLLGVGVLDEIAFLGGLLLIQDLELDHPSNLCCRRFGDNPRGVELLNALQAGNDGGLESRRGHHHEVVGECRIIWFALGKIEVEIDECCHQIGLTGSHRKAEQIVGIGHIVENLLEGCFIVYLVGMLLDILFEFRRNLIAFLVLQSRILEQCHSCLVDTKYLACSLCQFYLANIGIIECAINE